MMKKIFSIIIICILLINVVTFSFAASTTELNSQKDELEDKIDTATEEQENVKSQLTEEQQKIEEIAEEIEENEEKIKDINAQLTKLSNEITELKANLEEAEKKYEEQENFLKEKLVIDFESGETTYLDVLLNSKGILDFISKYYLISEVLQNDDDLLSSIEEQKNKIEADKAELEEKQKTVKSQKTELEKTKVILVNQKSQMQTKINQLSDEQKKLTTEIQEYKAEVKQIEAQLTAAANNASSTGKVYTGGKFLWPCPSYKYISSKYGYRICPFHGKELHSGIDMAAPYGAKILAAADGKVITAGWVNSYGYTVMIYHGSGLTTIYAHCSSLCVKVGDEVSQGDTIAKVGSTGDSTGNHLHFGVKLNGSYTDPGPYLGM